MKHKLITTFFLFVAVAGYGKPMTGAVSSWEGRFALSPEKIVIRVSGKPEIRLWLYKLEGGSEGTAVGFSNVEGDMILSPKPADKGVQPVYLQLQGNGGLLLVEKYLYDGTRIVPTCRSIYGGRHNPQWWREDETKGEPAPAADAPASRR